MTTQTVTQLSSICQSAQIGEFDTDFPVIHPYAELEIEVETPGAYTPSRYIVPQTYLVCWPGGVTVHYVTRKAPWQIQPSEIEVLYEQATHLPPISDPFRGSGRRC